MTALSSLLIDVQRRLESLYALEPQAPVTDFVLGEEEAAGLPGGGSRTLVTRGPSAATVCRASASSDAGLG